MSLGAIATFGVGFALLVLGPQLLVKGAARLALGLGVPPLVLRQRREARE